MTGTIRSAFSIIDTNKAAFLKIHLFFYALFLSTMAVTMAVPHLAPLVLSFVSKMIPLDGAARAYASGSIIRAASFTLMVNTLVATLWITLPSLVFRWAGVVTTMIFAFLYGFMLAPIGPYPGVMIPHTLTLLIEYEAYLVAALAAHLASNALRRDPVYGRREAISVTAILYVLVMPLLVLGAFYEAYEVTYLAPHFM